MRKPDPVTREHDRNPVLLRGSDHGCADIDGMCVDHVGMESGKVLPGPRSHCAHPAEALGTDAIEPRGRLGWPDRVDPIGRFDATGPIYEDMDIVSSAGLRTGQSRDRCCVSPDDGRELLRHMEDPHDREDSCRSS
jgi:hypothetical protein